MAHKETFILDFRADTKNVQQQFNQLKQTMANLGAMQYTGIGGKLTNEMRQASQEAMKMGAALKQAVNPTTGKLDLSRLNLSMKQAGLTAQGLRTSFSEIGASGRQAFMQIANAVANAQTPMLRTNAMLDKMWATMQNTMRWQISSTLLNSFVGAFRNAFSFAKDLNKNLNDIRIVSGDSAKEMERYAKSANNAAKAIGITTNDMVEATVIFRQQGDSLELSAKKAEITAKMASVSLGVSAEEMSEYLTGIWNSYKVGSQDLELFADKLARVGAVTASNAGELATAMTKVAATANVVGVSYDQLLATISTVSSATRQSEESIGTAFKTIYARMGDLQIKGSVDEDGVSTSLGDVSKKLKQAGFDILDDEGMIKDMGTVMEEIGGQWDTLTRNMQTSLAQALGGKRQYTQVMALFDNWDKYNKTLQESVNAQGELNTQHKIYLDSWDAATQKTKAIKEDLIMDFVDDDAIIGLVNIFNGLLTVFDDLVEGVGGFQGVLSMLMAFVANKFSKQIISSFQSIKANAMIFFGMGDKLAQKTSQDFTKELGSLQTKTPLETEQKNTIQTKLESQNIIAQKGQQLNELEREALDITLKQIEANRQLALQEEQSYRRRQQQIIDEINSKKKLTEQDKAALEQAERNIISSYARDKKTEKQYQTNTKEAVGRAVGDTGFLKDRKRDILTQRKELKSQIDSGSITGAELDNLKTKYKSLGKDLKNVNEEIKHFNQQQGQIRQRSPEKTLQTYANAFFGISMAASSASSAIKLFTDKDTNWKDINTYISLVGSLGGALMGLTMVVNVYNASKLKENLVTGWNIGSKILEAKLAKDEIALKTLNTKATNLNTTAKIANWAASHPLIAGSIALGIAIAGVTAYIIHNNDALVKANKEYNEHKKKLDEITEKYDEEKRLLEEKKQKLEEIGNLESDEAKRLQKSIQLQEHYVDILEKQKKLQDKITAEKAKAAILERKNKSGNLNINTSLDRFVKNNENLSKLFYNSPEENAKTLSNLQTEYATKKALNVTGGYGSQAQEDIAKENLENFKNNKPEKDFYLSQAKKAKSYKSQLQNYLDSEDYKLYVEQVQQLEDGEFKDAEMEKINAFNEEFLRITELTEIYEQYKDDQEGLAEALDIYNKKLVITKDTQNEVSKIMLQYGSSVATANKALDDMQSAFKTLNEAVYEYNQNGSISLDTFQTLVTMSPKYLSMLQNENGQLSLSTLNMEEYIRVQKENLIMQQVKETMNQLVTVSEEGLDAAIEYLTLTVEGHTGSLKDNIQEIINKKIAEIEAKAATDGLTAAEKKQIETLKNLGKRYGDMEGSLNDISVGIESSAKEVTDATQSLQEAQEALATFYLKKEFDKNKREIEKYAKFIENMDLAISYSGLEDKQTADAEKAKMVEMRKQLALTRAEFEKLSKMTPETASEAEEVSSRLEEYGESIKELTNNIKESERELENLKWSAATEAFDIQLEQINSLNDAMGQLFDSFGQSGVYSDLTQKNAARKALLSSFSTSGDADKNSLDKKKKDYQEYLNMTKEIDDKVNKAHEHALELSNKKEEESLQQKLKDARDTYDKVTKAHADAIEAQNEKTAAQLAYNKRTHDEWVKYCEENPAVSRWMITGEHVADMSKNSGATNSTNFTSAYTTTSNRVQNSNNSILTKDNLSLASQENTAKLLEGSNYWLLGDRATSYKNWKNPSSAFGKVRWSQSAKAYRIHRGVDYALEEGAPVTSWTRGTVQSVANQADGYGHYIVIKDNDTGYSYLYGHMESASSLKQGDSVYGGQVLGYVGKSGNATGPCLHVEVYKQSGHSKQYVDPNMVLGHALNYKEFNTASKGRTLSKAETVFVGETGAELVFTENNQKAFLVEKPSMLDLPAGAVIYNPEETKKILEAQKSKPKEKQLWLSPTPQGKTAAEMMSSADNGLGYVSIGHAKQYSDLLAHPENYSAQEVNQARLKMTNDQIWSIEQSIANMMTFMKTDNFAQLTWEKQKEYVEKLQKVIDEEDDIIKQHRENIEAYANQRWEAADKYIEKMNKFGLWSANNDSYVKAEIRLYNDLIDKTTDLAELDRIRAESWERIQSAMEAQISSVKAMGNLLIKDYEKQITRIEAEYSLTEKHYEMVNKLAEAQHSAEMSLYSSLQNARWLDEKTRNLIYNMEDYTRQTEQIAQIRQDEQDLFTQYLEDINDLSEDELWRAEFITAEYEKQLKIKEEEMALLAAEIDLTKKKEALNNTLMEKNVRVFSGGRWQYVANQANVQKAMTDFSEAQFKYDQQVTQNAQQGVLRNIEAGKTEAEKQIAEINAKITALEEAWEREILQLQYGEISLNSFNTAVDDTASAMEDAIVTLQNIKNTLGTGKDNEKVYGSDYRASVITNDRYAGLSGKDLGNALVADIVANRVLSKVNGSVIKRYQKNAKGSASTKGGWSQVNEEGIELYATRDGQFVELNPYEKIFNNEQFEFLYNLSKAGTEGVSSIMRSYSSQDSSMSIGNISLSLPNVTDTDSFVEGLKSLKDYIRNTKTINR